MFLSVFFFRTQDNDYLEERNRHASSLDTPVLDSPGDIPPPYSSLREPTTPRGEGKVYSAPYYTPSPSTRDSFISSSGKPLDTPGLVYLQVCNLYITYRVTRKQ